MDTLKKSRTENEILYGYAPKKRIGFVGGIILSEVTDGNSNYDTINAKWNNYKLNHNINIEPKLYPMPFKENPIDNSNYTKTLEILNKQIDGYFLIYAEFNTEVFNRE